MRTPQAGQFVFFGYFVMQHQRLAAWKVLFYTRLLKITSYLDWEIVSGTLMMFGAVAVSDGKLLRVVNDYQVIAVDHLFVG